MSRRTHTYALVLAGLLLGLQGCKDNTPTSPESPPDNAVLTQTGTQLDNAVDPVARGIAMALSDPGLRRQLLEDLRDSPFPKHGLHLQSYLRGTRGRVIAAAAAAAEKMETEQLLALVGTLPELQLSVPISYDRAFWTGTGDIVVTGSTLTQRQTVATTPRITGYTTRRGSIIVPTRTRLDFPLLAIFRAETTFGPDPEAVRQAGRHRSRNTISARAEEGFASTMGDETDPCNDPIKADMPCDEPVPGELAGGLTLPSGHTHACMNNVPADSDYDQDGVLDTCEYEIAHAFRPFMAYSTSDSGLGREPYWAVRKGEHRIRTRNHLPPFVLQRRRRHFLRH
jgi:hypothetical protein